MRYLKSPWIAVFGLLVALGLGPGRAQVSNWSQTAGTNATIDSLINWAEGMAPSAINDSARAMMARIAQWRDDTNGSLTTSGTSTAYTVTTNSTLASLTAGYRVCFAPHATSGNSPTLKIDGTAAKPLRSAPATELPPGVLILGSPYCATYYTSNSGEYIIEGYYAPGFTTGDIKLTIKSTADTGWLMLNDGTIGSAASGATRASADTKNLYCALYLNVSDTYAPVTGGRSGSNQAACDADFAANKPIALTKVLGRALAVSGSGSGLTSRALGLTTGGETIALGTSNLPPYTPSGTVTTYLSSREYLFSPQYTLYLPGGSLIITAGNYGDITATSSFSGSAQGGTSAPFSVMQPTSFFNVMIKL